LPQLPGLAEAALDRALKCRRSIKYEIFS